MAIVLVQLYAPVNFFSGLTVISDTRIPLFRLIEQFVPSLSICCAAHSLQPSVQEYTTSYQCVLLPTDEHFSSSWAVIAPLGHPMSNFNVPYTSPGRPGSDERWILGGRWKRASAVGAALRGLGARLRMTSVCMVT